MPRDDDADRLIARIYDTIDDVRAWEDVLSQICQRVGGENAIASGVPKSDGPVPFAQHYRTDPALTPKYSARHLKNPWAKWMVTHPVGVPVSSDAYVPVRDLKRSDFYGEILAPQRITHGALYRIADLPSFHVGMSIHRSDRAGAFTPAELAASERFMPHLRRAAQLRVLLDRGELQRRLALEALDHLASGVLIVDASGRVLFANRTARDLARTWDAVVLKHPTIRVRHREQNRRLLALVAAASRGGAGGALALSRASGGLPLAALVAPLKGALAATAMAAGLSAGAAAVFLTDPERQANPPAARLQDLYDFTPTEARVALQLAKSGTIPKAAAILKLSPETVRTHLKGIYAKTGVNQQSAVVRLLAAASML